MDENRVATLLHIADKSQQWPTLHGLRDRALEELKKLHEEAKKELEAIKKEAAEVEAKAKAKAAEVEKKVDPKVVEVEDEVKTDFSRLRKNFQNPGSQAEVE